MFHRKKNIFLFFLLVLVSVCAVYAQRIPVVGVAVFDTSGSGVTAAEAANLSNKVASELTSWGTLRVLQTSEGAEYFIRGTLTRSGNNFVLSAVTVNASTKQTLNEYSEQGRTLNDISITTLCAKAVEKVPLPNYLLGKWQSTINMPDGPVVCIMEFKSDRSVLVERYDTWEHKQNNALRYEGYGKGDYSYAGYANRLITVNSKQIRIDATISVNLALEESLPEQTSVNIRGISVLFNAEKTTFEIVNGSLLCGRNFDGPAVYSAAVIGFSQFVKIR
jgi:hypothetical protein